ncbi:MAG: carbohydrate kinase [Bacteroidales bacterium]|nr:carbohydrate kinase [Bacteroidales bacterium]
MAFKIAGIGELLWDNLPSGKQLGGAPTNFAYYMQQAGFETFVVSAVGMDRDGKEILEVLDQLQLNESFVQRTRDYPTGTVTVKLNPSGIPEYTIHENVAWDHIEWNDKLEALAKEVDAVCFGSLAQRDAVSRDTICRFLESTNPNCLRVFDINLRRSFYTKQIILRSLELANVLKINEEELPIVTEILGYSGKEESQLNQLLKGFDLRLIAHTMGSGGSLLLTPDEISSCQVPEIEVADTVGAGDAFTAILLAGMLNKQTLNTTHKIATELAAFVCTQNGATPKLPREILNQILM